MFCLLINRGDKGDGNDSDTDGNNDNNKGNDNNNIDHDNNGSTIVTIIINYDNDNEYINDNNSNTSNSNDRSNDFNDSHDKVKDNHKNNNECCSLTAALSWSPIERPELQRKNTSPNLLFSEVDERGTKRKSKTKNEQKKLAYIPLAFSGVANLLLVFMLLRFLCLFLGAAMHTLV